MAELARAALGGSITAIFSGFVWGLFSWLFGIQLIFLPWVGVGFLVARVIRGSREKTDWRFGLAAMTLALVGCLVGDAVSSWGVVISQLGDLPQAPLHPAAVWDILVGKFSIVDGVSYATAALEGWFVAQRHTNLPVVFERLRAFRGTKVAQVIVLMAFVLFFGLLFLQVHRMTIADLALSHDGQQVAVAQSGFDTSMSKATLVWSLAGGGPRSLAQQSVGSLSWSPNGKLLAVINNLNKNGPGSGRFSVWNVVQGQEIVIDAHDDFVKCLAYCPDERTLATGSQDRTVKLWDVPVLRERATLQEKGAISSLAFSNDGAMLAVGMRNGEASLWDVPACRRLAAVPAHKSAVTSVMFGPDGHTLYSAGGVDGTVKVWNVPVLRQRATFPLNFGWITALAGMPDGNVLAVAGGSFQRNGEVKLLDLKTGRETKHFTVYGNTVSAIALTSDGKTLFAGTAAPINCFSLRRNGETYRWNVATGELLPPLP